MTTILKGADCLSEPSFTADARLFVDSTKGIWDIDIADIEGAFATNFSMSKADRLATKDSWDDHAMIITGAHIVDGRPVRFKVENSFGKEKGQDGELEAIALPSRSAAVSRMY